MSDSGEMKHRLALPAGTVLSGYRLDAVLGKGGFGLTYLATDLRLGMQVAIKELLPDGVATRVEGSTVVAQSRELHETYRWALQRFEQEARLLAGLTHPNIVRVLRLIEENGTAYMVMEYIAGVSLKDLIRKNGPLDEPTALLILQALMSGLEYVHSKGLFHRDVKPDNVFMTLAGQPVLLDFGSARQDLGHSVSMTAIVSKGYSPFEQYQTRGKQGAWTDIYSLAGTMIFSLTGETPADATDRIGNEEPADWLVKKLKGRYTAGTLKGLEHGFKVNSSQRPPSIADWRPHFSPGAEDGGPGGGSGVFKPLAYALAGFVFIGLISAVIFWKLHQPIIKPPISEDSQPAPVASPATIAENSQPSRLEPSPPPAAPPSAPAPLKADPEALYRQANVLFEKRNNTADAEAMKLYQQAADLGLAKAYGGLARGYIAGRGLPRDYDKAVQILPQAIGHDDGLGENCMGAILEYGWGKPMNPSEAVAWYQKAAELGFAGGQCNLARCYANGIGIPVNAAEAARWYLKAAEQGHVESEYWMGWLYQTAEGVPQRDVAESRKWYLKAAERGYGPAQYNLGISYLEEGEGERDRQEGINWLKRAAAQGNVNAQRVLSDLPAADPSATSKFPARQ